jgi:hypothetical protein
MAFGMGPTLDCAGGTGGAGAGGNGGQGGPGGLSLAIGYAGVVPTFDSSTTAIVLGKGGLGGAGGSAGAASMFSTNPGVSGGAGVDGVAQETPMGL